MRTLRALGTVTNLGGEQPLGSIVGALIEVRFTAAARAARVESRVSVHTGRVGRVSQTDELGISTADVMFAEYWRMSRMVPHYSAGQQPTVPLLLTTGDCSVPDPVHGGAG